MDKHVYYNLRGPLLHFTSVFFIAFHIYFYYILLITIYVNFITFYVSYYILRQKVITFYVSVTFYELLQFTAIQLQPPFDKFGFVDFDK